MKLATELRLFLQVPFADLPPALQRKVASVYWLVPWDDLSASQRLKLAVNWDHQRPATKPDKDQARRDLDRGFAKVSVPRRNKKLGARRRPAAQRITDEQILRAWQQVAALKPHQRCNAAFRLLYPAKAPLSVQAFRKRWNRLGLAKKKET